MNSLNDQFESIVFRIRTKGLSTHQTDLVELLEETNADLYTWDDKDGHPQWMVRTDSKCKTIDHRTANTLLLHGYIEPMHPTSWGGWVFDVVG